MDDDVGIHIEVFNISNKETIHFFSLPLLAMTKKRTSIKKRTKKSAETSFEKNEATSNAAKVIAKWWKRLKTGQHMRSPFTLTALREPPEVSTPFTAQLSNMSIMSTPRKTFYDDDNWEKVVAAAELAESMTSPTRFALFEGNWEDVVAAAEKVEAMFFPNLK